MSAGKMLCTYLKGLGAFVLGSLSLCSPAHGDTGTVEHMGVYLHDSLFFCFFFSFFLLELWSFIPSCSPSLVAFLATVDSTSDRI